MILHNLMVKYGSDKPAHGFCDFYESFFQPVRAEVKYVLEIGVANGASVRAWLDYFPNAEVWGLDAANGLVGQYGDLRRWPLTNNRFHPCIGDQANRDDLAQLIAHGADWDIVIDDGGHTMEQQQVSLGVLFPHTTRFYVVEDLHTSFMTEITICESGEPARSYPTGVGEVGTTYDLLKAEYPDVHIFDRDGDHKHITSVLEVR